MPGMQRPPRRTANGVQTIGPESPGAREGFKLMASLRPALKHGSKTYTAPLTGQHLDAWPAHLAAEFYRRAMRGDDLSEYRFGFVDGEGNFLNREDA
jgi:hypothetical protein